MQSMPTSCCLQRNNISDIYVESSSPIVSRCVYKTVIVSTDPVAFNARRPTTAGLVEDVLYIGVNVSV